ncbi:hypothetical protein IW140_000713 [Coemansia sp. RSA 1813]|nr:hypothetical protein EV179_000523 [Coemansia sp. RSA 487]KAJ2572598.1 hypothetical protein IW140_000713 [Coemansia sp. RSA 1813]
MVYIDGNKDVTRTLADADIATIARRAGPALSKLSLDFVPHLSDAARPLKLHTLKLCNMDHSLSADIMQRAMVPESITGPEHAWSFADFALVVPNLVSISLGGENNCITDDLVVQIATNCKHLVSIDVHGSIRLSHPSLAALGENCARLEYVDISECLGCEDRGVVALVSRCGALKSLNLSGLHIGDDSLSVIGDCLRGLERLVLDSCWRITSQGIRSMVARFSESGCTRKLRRLSFIDCISVGVDDVAWCRERLHPSAKITGSSVVPFV